MEALIPDADKQRLKKNRKKAAVFILLLVVVGGIFAMGLPEYLTLERLGQSLGKFQAIYACHPVLCIVVFTGIYILVLALNIPGALVLGLAGGALFGTITGTVVISFASAVGATLGCMTARYLLRDWVQKKFGDRLARINRGIAEEGAFYLFSMRLIPAIPFFAINLVMGLTPMRLTTFYWVSQLGMLPATAIFVNAGSQIAQIDSLSGIISGQLTISLALVGLFPIAAKRLISVLRKKQQPIGRISESPFKNHVQEAVDSAGTAILEKCTRCGACQAQCTFLTQYGTPGKIAELTPSQKAALAFECSLCGLCRSVCPEALDPGAWFLDLRRAAVSQQQTDLSQYANIIGYEKRGTSSLFSYYAFPKDCDTIFFPGCTLPGTRPKTTWKLFQYLRAKHPSLGIVLDCCTKPSHDLGRQDYFTAMFSELLNFLKMNGITTVWLACPNCYKVFSSFAHGIRVESVYEVIDRMGGPNLTVSSAFENAELAVHDPCPMRNAISVQDSIRSLLGGMNMSIGKTAYEKKKTLCCGEGGSVGCINPELSVAWAAARKKTARGRTIVTYCAGCTGFLNRANTPAVHILDLLFSTDRKKSPAVSNAPFTYLHRLALKRKLKRTVPAAVSRVRTYSPNRNQWELDYPVDHSAQAADKIS
jgi:uncharacterized membrane protein YdjX (TVP38/TMEM64 family)/Fe-S oxidoreductase